MILLYVLFFTYLSGIILSYILLVIDARLTKLNKLTRRVALIDNPYFPEYIGLTSWLGVYIIANDIKLSLKKKNL
ncbi:hypothetical protein ACE939_00730 [Aquimarina sp. W85]|uniref:hypothetical protein n=1 Tax=Aquimarina rhodophyticola TaxID=3342246 RepID=UPI00366E5F7F